MAIKAQGEGRLGVVEWEDAFYCRDLRGAKAVVNRTAGWIKTGKDGLVVIHQHWETGEQEGTYIPRRSHPKVRYVRH